MDNSEFDDLEWDYAEQQVSDDLEWDILPEPKEQIEPEIEVEQITPTKVLPLPEVITPNLPVETTFDISKREVEEDIKYTREKTKEALDVGLDILKNLSASESADIKGVSMLLKEIIEGNRQLLGIHQQKDTILSGNEKQLEIPGGISTNINKAIIFQGNSTQFDELLESYKNNEE